jgi:HAMP domain-containing protein
MPRLTRPLALGFAARLGLSVSLLVLVLCVSQSWFLADRHLADVRAYLTQRGRTISEYLAHEAEAGILSGNVEELGRLAALARAQDGVGYVRLFDGQGLLLASAGKWPERPSGPQETLPGSDAVAVGDGLLEFRTPILTAPQRPRRVEMQLLAPTAALEGGPRTELVGSVVLGISLDSLQAVRRRTLATATLFAALFTAAGVVVALLLARAMTGPLKALATAADTIAKGDLCAELDIRRDDEVGGLARAFNAMIASLAQSRATLEKLRQTPGPGSRSAGRPDPER